MKLKISAIFLAIFLIIVGHASASTITFTHDYGAKLSPTKGDGPGGTDYWTLNDDNATRFSDYFNLRQFTSLTSVDITVNHKDNRNFAEYWKMEADNHALQVGWLSRSSDGWTPDNFSIDSSYFSNILDHGGIGFHFSEFSLGDDQMKLDSIVFTVVGETSAVPVPAALWLFGSGLLGLAGIRRKMK